MNQISDPFKTNNSQLQNLNNNTPNNLSYSATQIILAEPLTNQDYSKVLSRLLAIPLTHDTDLQN